METAASFEARFAPWSYPATRTYGGEGGEDTRLSPLSRLSRCEFRKS